MSSMHTIFAADGPIATVVAGYQPRQAQIDMAAQLAKKIKAQQSLIIEAGTGTGKTFAYLVAIIESGKKAIISTGTKNLQDQLFKRDLPLIQKVLAKPLQVALLKGRSNYLCPYRLKLYAGSNDPNSTNLQHYGIIKRWSLTTKSGDLAELKDVPEDASIFPSVTSTIDNCMGKDCPDIDHCWVLQARAKAMNADIIVVNHHLFFADLALKDTGFGELIPEAQVVLFDEAHQVPDIAIEYFGKRLSTRLFSDLSKQVDVLYRTELKDMSQLAGVMDRLGQLTLDIRSYFPEKPQRGKWQDYLHHEPLQESLRLLQSCLQDCVDVAKVHIGRHKDIDTVYEKLVLAKDTLPELIKAHSPGESLWYETSYKQVTFHATPLSIAERFRQIMQAEKKSWIFTSATLKVGEDFSHFQQQMGLEQIATDTLVSPFDYPQQALLCVPTGLPDPSHRDFTAALVPHIRDLIIAAKGNIFLLFTSHRACQYMASLLQAEVTNPLLVQGSKSKQALLNDFHQQSHAVLLATAAFWEGVDVRGNQLVCVVIDKLPFAAPDDPLLQAKLEDCKLRGGSPFGDIQIPEAVIQLKQGAGRLIRDVNDRGVLVICDPRLVGRDYGKTFLSSLPPMQRTRSINKACDFVRQILKEDNQ